MSECFTCRNPLFDCTCSPGLQSPPDHPECGELTRQDWDEVLTDINNRYRVASEKEIGGEERPASEGVTHGLRRGNLAMLYGRSGGKSVAGELMLLIEIARTAYRYRLVPLSATDQTLELAKLDKLLRQFAKLDEPKPYVL